ncbi:MAG: MmcQ/YjbR family DNA-binding protein [Bacteroidetes bacterium]|nr:MmcQ/YjbR family DNA-binding protein [Bacteroidota bacterium]
MNAEIIRDHCLLKKGATEEFPFDEDTLVFKVMGKMFLLMSLDGDLSINLKCAPEKAVELREQYPSILPGYHQNKKHWNTVLIDGSVSWQLISQWIDESYDLVVSNLTKDKKASLSVK